MWFPELFNRFDEYARVHPGESASVCKVTEFVVQQGSQQHGGTCSDKIGSAVFMESLITVAAALPSNIIAVLGMDRLGRKFFLGKSPIVFPETVTHSRYFSFQHDVFRTLRSFHVFRVQQNSQLNCVGSVQQRYFMR